MVAIFLPERAYLRNLTPMAVIHRRKSSYLSTICAKPFLQYQWWMLLDQLTAVNWRAVRVCLQIYNSEIRPLLTPRQIWAAARYHLDMRGHPYSAFASFRQTRPAPRRYHNVAL
jgi:hypothetical protein